jgi:hypothetical protein
MVVAPSVENETTFKANVSYLSHISPITFFRSMLLNVKLFLVVTPPTGGPNTTGFTVDFVDNINEALSDSIYILLIDFFIP